MEGTEWLGSLQKSQLTRFFQLKFPVKGNGVASIQEEAS